MLSSMLEHLNSSEVNDNEQLDDKLDRLNSRVQTLMLGLTSLDEPTSVRHFDFSIKSNEAWPAYGLTFAEQAFEHDSQLSDISENHTIFEHSFIETAAQLQTDAINQLGMQVEDFRSHELRDEEQMLSFDEFVELSNKVTCCGPKKVSSMQGSLENRSTGSSADCEGLSHSRDRLERELEDLDTKICCMRLQGSDVSRFSLMMEKSKTLLAQLQGEVNKSRRINTGLTARQQQLDIQKVQIKEYQAKLKAKMKIVKHKATVLHKQEEDLVTRTSRTSQLSELKNKLELVLSDQGKPSAEIPQLEPKLISAGIEGGRRMPRSQTVLTLASQEKVNKILEQTQRQNKNFTSLMQKLSVLPKTPQHEALPKATPSSPVKTESTSRRTYEKSFEQRERELEQREQQLRCEQRRLIKVKEELQELIPLLSMVKH